MTETCVRCHDPAGAESQYCNYHELVAAKSAAEAAAKAALPTKCVKCGRAPLLGRTLCPDHAKRSGSHLTDDYWAGRECRTWDEWTFG